MRFIRVDHPAREAHLPARLAEAGMAGALAMALAAACGRSPSTERTVADALSWTESALLTSQRWRAHAVPSRFAEEALDMAERELRSEDAALRSAHADSSLHSAVLVALHAADSALHLIRRDVAPAAVDAPIATLDSAARQLRSARDAQSASDSRNR